MEKIPQSIINTIHTQLLQTYGTVRHSPQITFHYIGLSIVPYNERQRFCFPPSTPKYDYFVMLKHETSHYYKGANYPFATNASGEQFPVRKHEDGYLEILDVYPHYTNGMGLQYIIDSLNTDFITYFDACMEAPTRIKERFAVIRDEYFAKLYEPSRMERMEALYGDAIWESF